jgi:hypothetical protein
MKKYLYIFIILPLTFTMNSCFLTSVNCLDGSGEILREERKVADFDKLSIDGGLDLYLKQGDSTLLQIEVDDNLAKYIHTEVIDRELQITETKSLCSKIKRAYLTIPNLKELTINGAGKIIANSKISFNYLQIEGNGASDGYFEDLNCPNLMVDLSGSGDARINKGIGGNLSIRISGAGDVKFKDFAVDSAKVEISGAGDVLLQSNTFLLVKIFGAGDVKYKGSPKLVKKIVGAGTVHQIEN